MDFLMNPENIALLLGALVALVGAVAFAIRQISMAVNSWIETRNKVKVMEAEIVRLHAEAQTREQDGENERDTKIINILERLTDQNGRWPPIAEDFATAQNRYAELFESFNRTNEKVAAGLTAMASENKALRISFEQWPSAIDGKLETVDETLGDLVKKVAAVETAIGQGNTEHSEIKAILHDEVVAGIDKITALLTPPDHTNPDDRPTPAGNVKPLNADGAQYSADIPKAS